MLNNFQGHWPLSLLWKHFVFPAKEHEIRHFDMALNYHIGRLHCDCKYFRFKALQLWEYIFFKQGNAHKAKKGLDSSKVKDYQPQIGKWFGITFSTIISIIKCTQISQEKCPCNQPSLHRPLMSMSGNIQQSLQR